MELSIALTPPKARSQAGLKPSSILTHTPTQDAIKRKMLLDVEDHQHDAEIKRVRLEPALLVEDETVGHFHARVDAILPGDRDYLRVVLPTQEPWKARIYSFLI